MKRYRLRQSPTARTSQKSETAMVEHPDGEWVRFNDMMTHAAAAMPEVWLALYQSNHKDNTNEPR